MPTDRPTVSESERHAAVIEGAAKGFENRGFVSAARDLRAAAARIRELEDALNVVRLACEHPVNRTSHTQRQMVQFLDHLRKQVVSRLAHTESEDRNG